MARLLSAQFHQNDIGVVWTMSPAVLDLRGEAVDQLERMKRRLLQERKAPDGSCAMAHQLEELKSIPQQRGWRVKQSQAATKLLREFRVRPPIPAGQVVGRVV